MKKYFLILSLFLTGCATIMGEKTQVLPISSNPSGSSYTIKDETGTIVQKGTTPSTVNLMKHNGSYFGKKSYTVEFTKKGYKSVSYPLQTSANGYYMFGNLVFGGLIGYLILDPLNGGMYKITPEAIKVDLAK